MPDPVSMQMANDHIPTTTCCASVRAGTDGWRTRYKPCSRKASVEREGKWYCGQHDPQAVADRKKTNESQWETEYQERQARYRLEGAAPDLLAALKDVLRVADRKTVEFDAARAAIAKAEGAETHG